MNKHFKHDENWEPKSGEIILVSQTGIDFTKRIFIKKDDKVFTCVGDFYHDKYIKNGYSDEMGYDWQYARPLEKYEKFPETFVPQNHLKEWVNSDDMISISKEEYNSILDKFHKISLHESYQPGKKYEFYDDEFHSEELILIGSCAGKYFGVTESEYDELTKGWVGEAHAYSHIREIKQYPEITLEEISEKFGVPINKIKIKDHHISPNHITGIFSEPVTPTELDCIAGTINSVTLTNQGSGYIKGHYSDK